jgi:DNA-binding Xre family transcriptional regulator
MNMRIRINELLQKRGLSPYGLAMESKGRISLSAAHRLARMDGRVKLFSASLLDALCDALNVDPNELLERESTKKARKA